MWPHIMVLVKILFFFKHAILLYIVRESSHSLIVKKGDFRNDTGMNMSYRSMNRRTSFRNKQYHEFHLNYFFFITTNHDMVIFQNLSRFWEDIKKNLNEIWHSWKRASIWFIGFLKLFVFTCIYFRVEYPIKHPWGLITCRVWTLILVQCSSGYIYELL